MRIRNATENDLDDVLESMAEEVAKETEAVADEANEDEDDS